MAALVLTAATVGVGSAWSAPSTAPGLGAGVTIAGTVSSSSDISGFLTSVQIPLSVEMVETTNFASGGFKQMIPGLKSASLQFAFNQDFAASQLHAIINTTLGGLGSLVYVDVKATSASRSATNPSYVFAFYIHDYTPISGSVGEKNGFSVTWQTTGIYTALTS